MEICQFSTISFQFKFNKDFKTKGAWMQFRENMKQLYMVWVCCSCKEKGMERKSTHTGKAWKCKR